MASPRPIPTKLKLARGNPGKRPLNDAEPEPRPGVPAPPSWLTKDGRDHWYKVVPELSQMGVLTLIDADTLAEYCALWSYQHTEHLYMKKHGKNLEPKERSLLLRTMLIVSAQLVRLQVEFGMTPSSRTKIKVDKVKPDDSLEAKFFGKKTTGM